MKNVFAILAMCFLISTINTYAGVKLVSGSLKPLKGEKQFNLQFEYNNIYVKKLSEDEYVKEQVEKKNSSKAGSGDAWKEEWFNNRKEKFEPRFEELFTKHLSDKNAFASIGNEKAKYTIIVKTVFIDPGWSAGISEKPSFIDYEIDIVESANPTNIIAKLEIDNVSGSGASRAFGINIETSAFRFQESYAKCGKILAKYLVKEI